MGCMGMGAEEGGGLTGVRMGIARLALVHPDHLNFDASKCKCFPS